MKQIASTLVRASALAVTVVVLSQEKLLSGGACYFCNNWDYTGVPTGVCSETDLGTTGCILHTLEEGTSCEPWGDDCEPWNGGS